MSGCTSYFNLLPVEATQILKNSYIGLSLYAIMKNQNFWTQLPFLLLFSFPCLGQPMICGNPALMTPTCQEACIICDIDGFTGRNSSFLKGVAPPGFCTGTVHNIQWIAFIAGTVDLTLEVTVSNCNSGAGLEIGIYKSNDCKTFQLVSECDGDVRENTTRIFKNTVPLIVGQHYYFVIDGNMADMCNYYVHVTKGSTKVAPLTVSGDIFGDFNVCQGGTYTFKREGVSGAIIYTWTVDGKYYGSGDSVSIAANSSGEFQLCVVASNACSEALPTCKTIQVLPTKKTLLQPNICSGDCYSVDTFNFCKTGFYNIHLLAENGCDSTVNLELKVNPLDTTTFSINLCQGDTLRLANKIYTASGLYEHHLNNFLGCDSLLKININMIQCNLQSTPQIIPIRCFGESNGSIIISVINGTPPFHYTIEKIDDSNYLGSGNLIQLNQSDTIKNLTAGLYSIKIEDNFGNIKLIQAVVNEPPILQSKLVSKDYQGYQLKCAEDQSGQIIALANGGQGNYHYQWSNGSVTNSIQNLSAGIYDITITDDNGCDIIDHIELIEPKPLKLSLKSLPPNCSGPETGSIQIESLSGGVQPYAIFLDGVNKDSVRTYNSLGEGKYQFTLRDENGCEVYDSIELIAAIIPSITMDLEREIQLGDSTVLFFKTTTNLDRIVWVKADHLSCDTCANPTASPVNNTTYKVTVYSKDGCSTEAYITVIVIKDKRIFAPNVFSPNGDHINDAFTIFGTSSLKSIKRLQIYDRWGGLVFDKKDLVPSDPFSGWDGTIQSQLALPGVYVWYAEGLFLDDEVVKAHGDLTLVR